ncbi:MAG: flagellar basal-body rod protein FlgB [Methylophagaceae bacterium]|jgi:flagellar basal-body rod protein FlgB
MPINFDSALGIHPDALRVRSQRAELLASNLSNADTPGYKARDIDFKSALKMANSGDMGAMKVSHQNHMQPLKSLSNLPHVQYRGTIQDSLDGNSVDEQIEQAAFMENSIQYQASVEFLGGKFNGLLKAIKGE